MIDPIIQYIIVRNDLNSMTPGRAAAQAAHAANQCQTFCDRSAGYLVEQWQQQTDLGFGTTIVLQANYAMIQLIKMEL